MAHPPSPQHASYEAQALQAGMAGAQARPSRDTGATRQWQKTHKSGQAAGWHLGVEVRARWVLGGTLQRNAACRPGHTVSAPTSTCPGATPAAKHATSIARALRCAKRASTGHTRKASGAVA
jgi:hypothetical protein